MAQFYPKIVNIDLIIQYLWSSSLLKQLILMLPFNVIWLDYLPKIINVDDAVQCLWLDSLLKQSILMAFNVYGSVFSQKQLILILPFNVMCFDYLLK